MVDYSVYLVTDSTMIPDGCTFLGQVEQAINSGATLVQLREKSLSTAEYISRAEAVHKLTKAKGIPLIINDRVDVALAIDAEGVHVGQDDMPAGMVRKLIGPEKILGVTCSNVAETEAVVAEAVADYVGLGTVYPTNTKKNVTDPNGTGPIGIRKMLSVLAKHNQNHSRVSSVAIGGINHSNAAQVLYQCQVDGEKLDGLAVVSCIMASADAASATDDLNRIIRSPSPWLVPGGVVVKDTTAVVRKTAPLVHQVTNNVVKNFSANVTLAVGGSPIMSELVEEFEEFAKLPNVALLVNMGTPNTEAVAMYCAAIRAYNATHKHIVFDPVAAGASKARLQAASKVLNSGVVSVIKGNPGEIYGLSTLTANYASGTVLESKGVDFEGELDDDERKKLAQLVSREFKCIVVVTGARCCIADATNAVTVAKGHPLMGKITGSGCSLGSVIATHLAVVENSDATAFSAVVDAVTRYGEAGEAASHFVHGPGSFTPKFLDELSKQE